MNAKKLDNLPQTSDEYWDGAETFVSTPKKVNLCGSHFKKWKEHKGYLDNHDGSISCKFCPWGTKLPGYIRVLNEKIVDLRTFSGE